MSPKPQKQHFVGRMLDSRSLIEKRENNNTRRFYGQSSETGIYETRARHYDVEQRIHLRSVDENEGDSDSYRLFYPGFAYHRARVVGRKRMQGSFYPATRAGRRECIARN